MHRPRRPRAASISSSSSSLSLHGSDIVAVVESHLRLGDSVDDIEGYEFCDQRSQQLPSAVGRGTRGVAVWLRNRNNVANYTALAPLSYPLPDPGAALAAATHSAVGVASLTLSNRSPLLARVQWIQILGRARCMIERPTYCAFVYAPTYIGAPAAVAASAAFWVAFTDEAMYYSSRGDIIIMGDLNGRIGARVGDSVKNSNGNHILSMCDSLDLVILNESYAFGERTFHPNRNTAPASVIMTTAAAAGHAYNAAIDGVSIIDYVIASRDAIHRVVSMSVADVGVDSDHLAVRLQWRTSSAPAPTPTSVSLPRTTSPAQQSQQLRAARAPPRFAFPHGSTDLRYQAYRQSIAAVSASLSLSFANPLLLTPVQLVEQRWCRFQTLLMFAASAAFGPPKRRATVHSLPYDRELAMQLARRNQLYSACIQLSATAAATRLVSTTSADAVAANAAAASARSAFEMCRRDTRRMVRQKHRQRNFNLFKQLVECEFHDRARFWRIISTIRGKKKPTPLPNRMIRVGNVSGGTSHTASETELLQQWSAYQASIGHADDDDKLFDRPFFDSVMSDIRNIPLMAGTSGLSVVLVPSDLDRPITRAEVAVAIKKMQSNKASDLQSISAELLTHGGEPLVDAVFDLFTTIFEAEHIPDDWLTAMIVPLYKKHGVRDAFGSYRPIALMSIVFKCYEHILHDRISLFAEKNNLLPEEQAGFRRNRSTIDHNYVLRELINDRRERQQSTFLCFLDLQKAYDLCWRDGMWWLFESMGIDGRLLRILRNMYRYVGGRVVVNGKLSPDFSVELGVRQGSVLSPLLFALFFSCLVRAWRLRPNLGVPIDGSNPRTSPRVAGLLFADDTVLIAESIAMMHFLLQLIEQFARELRVRFNGVKSAIVLIRGKKFTDTEFIIQQQTIPILQSYPYLGITLESSCRWHTFHTSLINKGKAVFANLYHCGTRARGVMYDTADRLVQIILWPSMQYGNELAEWNGQQQQERDKLQNRVGRAILGVSPRARLLLIHGELAWLPLQANTHLAQLRYWNRLQLLPDSQLTKQLFVARFLRFQHQQRVAAVATSATTAAAHKPKKQQLQYGYARMIYSTLATYGLLEHFTVVARRARSDWKKLIHSIVTAHYRNLWWQQLHAPGVISSPTVQFYLGCRRFSINEQSPFGWCNGGEPYLKLGGMVQSEQSARVLRAQLRTSTAPLAALDSYHWHGNTNASIGATDTVPSPVCNHCMLNAIDDQVHVLCICPLHADDRRRLFKIVAREWRDAVATAPTDVPEWYSRSINAFGHPWSSMPPLLRAQWLLSYDGSDSLRLLHLQINAFIRIIFSRRRLNVAVVAAAAALSATAPPAIAGYSDSATMFSPSAIAYHRQQQQQHEQQLLQRRLSQPQQKRRGRPSGSGWRQRLARAAAEAAAAAAVPHVTLGT